MLPSLISICTTAPAVEVKSNVPSVAKEAFVTSTGRRAAPAGNQGAFFCSVREKKVTVVSPGNITAARNAGNFAEFAFLARRVMATVPVKGFPPSQIGSFATCGGKHCQRF